MVENDTELIARINDALSALGSGSRRVRFSTEVWTRRFEAVEAVQVNFAALNGGLTRSEMLELVDRGIRANRHVDAFVIAMVWGYGPAGYGAHRTHEVLVQTARRPQPGAEIPTVSTILEASAHVARQDTTSIEGITSAAHDAYLYLNNGYGYGEKRSGRLINGFGPSFFTKWISAASARGNEAPQFALPILDDVIIAWWQRHVDATFERGYTDRYCEYTARVHDWAARLSDARDSLVSPLRIEEAIFESATGRTGEDPRPVSMDEVFVDLPV